MANPHPNLIRKGRYWHYSLKVGGQRAHGSTRATDLGTAKKVMEAKRKELLEGEVHRREAAPTFNKLVEEWFRINRSCLSSKHLTRTEEIARIWLSPRLGSMPINRIMTSDALAIRSRVLEAGRSQVTANNILRTLKFLLNFAVRMQYLERNRCKVTFLRIQRKPRPTLPAARVQEFLDAVDRATTCPQKRCMIRVMLGMGLRIGEVRGMRREWFDLTNRTYTVGKAKGKEARVIPVPSWLWTAIHDMPQPTLSDLLFPAEDGKPHRSQFCMKMLRQVCESMKLGNITQHRLRATFASLHAEAGTPITQIQGMLGHKNIATTMIYVETSLEAKRRAQDALSERLGFSIELGSPAAAV